MLHVNRTTKWASLAAVGLILLAGGLRLVEVGAWRATGVPLACLGPMIYVGLLLGWGISLDHRLTDRRVKRLLLASVTLMVLWFVLRCAKYDFFDAYGAVRRRLWYGYYIPMNLLPTLTFLAAQSIGLGESRSLRREALCLLLPDVLFTALVLTNDCHQLVFGFPHGLEGWDDYYTQLPLFFVLYAWIAAQYVGALGIIFRKCRISKSRRLVWLPVIWVAMITVFFFWYNANQFLPIQKPFQMTEMVCIVLAATWESCIQTGLIPSNIGYREFFNASTLDGQITDGGGRVRFSSQGAASLTDKQRRAAIAAPLLLEPDVQLQSRAIPGGGIFWKDDLADIHRLNRELEEAKAALAEENDLIRAENEAKEEQARLREQNRLYDRMAGLARPQLEEIRRLLDGLTPDDPDFARRLGEACVRNAYIKRRSNLTLLAEKETAADAGELGLCIRESLEYLTACGVVCSFQQSGTGSIPLPLICRAYEFFESAIEPALSELRALLVRLSLEEGVWVLRIVMDGPAALPGAEEEDGALYLTFRLEEGER